VLKPTPHPKPTPINASQLPTLYYTLNLVVSHLWQPKCK
jgi:hypothetical protein